MTSTLRIDKSLFAAALGKAMLPGIIVDEILEIILTPIGEVVVVLKSPALPDGFVKVHYRAQEGVNGEPPRKYVASVEVTPYPNAPEKESDEAAVHLTKRR